MATRPRKKASTPDLGHPVLRREQQVQGLDDQTVQALKAALADIQAALDSHGNSRPERLGGSIWADLYTRSGTFIGTLYHALPEQLLSKVGVLDVRVVPPPGGFFRGSGENQPTDSSTVGRGLSGHARTGVPKYPDYFARQDLSKVSGRGGTLYHSNGGGEHRSSKRSGGGNKVSPNRKRSRV